MENILSINRHLNSHKNISSTIELCHNSLMFAQLPAEYEPCDIMSPKRLVTSVMISGCLKPVTTSGNIMFQSSLNWTFFHTHKYSLASHFVPTKLRLFCAQVYTVGGGTVVLIRCLPAFHNNN